jgi:hypothetical protein
MLTIKRENTGREKTKRSLTLKVLDLNLPMFNNELRIEEFASRFFPILLMMHSPSFIATYHAIKHKRDIYHLSPFQPFEISMDRKSIVYIIACQLNVLSSVLRMLNK